MTDPDPRTDDLADALLALLDEPAIERRALPPANFWSIVHYGEQSYENRYNRVVRWLLDPTENHGLDAAVVNALIAAVWGGPGEQPVVGVRRVRTGIETPVPRASDTALAGRIDITVVDHANRVVIAIESKLASSAHDEQLRRYREWITSAYAGWQHVLVFLTEVAEQPDDEGWTALTYGDFVDVIAAARETRKVAPRVDAVIDDFVADVDRRGAGPADERIAGLFFTDAAEPKPAQVRFADLLLAVADEIEPADAERRAPHARLASYVARLRSSAPAPAASDVFGRLTTRFEERSRSSSELVRTLSYVLDHAPRILAQDHAKAPGVAEFFSAYAEYLTGRALRSARDGVSTVRPEQSLGGYLRTVRVNQGGKGVTFNERVEGVARFRVSGNDLAVFPWWVGHIGDETRNIPRSACGIVGARVQTRPLAEWTPEDLHAAVLAALRDFAAHGDGRCGCGEAIR